MRWNGPRIALPLLALSVAPAVGTVLAVESFLSPNAKVPDATIYGRSIGDTPPQHTPPAGAPPGGTPSSSSTPAPGNEAPDDAR